MKCVHFLEELCEVRQLILSASFSELQEIMIKLQFHNYFLGTSDVNFFATHFIRHKICKRLVTKLITIYTFVTLCIMASTIFMLTNSLVFFKSTQFIILLPLFKSTTRHIITVCTCHLFLKTRI